MNLLNCSSLRIAEAPRRGLDPKVAATLACTRTAATNLDPRLRDERGRPNFDVTFDRVGKDGRHVVASIWGGGKMAAHEGESARLVDCASLCDEISME